MGCGRLNGVRKRTAAEAALAAHRAIPHRQTGAVPDAVTDAVTDAAPDAAPDAAGIRRPGGTPLHTLRHASTWSHMKPA